MLIQTLRQLETHNFVKRKDFKTLPPKVKYSLTKKGKESLDLVPLLVRIGNTIHLDI
jgi:DNA-binding HxlR family transcriptional regulator